MQARLNSVVSPHIGELVERIVWVKQSVQPFYVFDEKHIVSFWDDGLNVSHAATWYKDVNANISPLSPPHVYLKTLSLEFFRKIVLEDRVPISIVLEGENLGATKLTSGYGEADIGPYQRKIVKQQTQVWSSQSCLNLSFELETTPVDPKSAHAVLREEDKAPKNFSFKFAIPLDNVAEVLNFTERERQTYSRSRLQKSMRVASSSAG